MQASPNPEFAASPANFAHFFLAVIFPLVRELAAVGVHDPFRSTLLLWHGSNAVFMRWKPAYNDLLGAGATCKLRLTHRPRDATELLERRRSFGCDAWVSSIAVKQWSFRNRSFFEPAPWRQFSRTMRRHFLLPPLHGVPTTMPAARRIVVMLRERSRMVNGLSRACDEAWAVRALDGLHVRVHCLRLGHPSQMLSTAAHALIDAEAVVAGHGSGLATLPFLPAGARFAELDNIMNAARARNMYMYLANALGLVATKVWLNASGARFCPHRVIGCTSADGGMSIHGCAVGYTGNVTLPENVLRDVLRDAALGSPNAGVDCGIDMDATRPKFHGFDVDEEMERPWTGTGTADGIAGGASRRIKAKEVVAYDSSL